MAHGRQLQVFVHPDDAGALAEALVSVHGARILATKWRQEEVPGDEPALAEPFALLAPSELVREIRPRSIPSRGEWVPDVVGDPVVEWHRSRLLDDRLFVGRFYFIPERADGTAKDDVFISFSTGLFRWLKRNLDAVDVDGRRVLCTPTAHDESVAGTLILSLAHVTRALLAQSRNSDERTDDKAPGLR